MCEICCELFIFQWNNVSAQWVRTASVSVSPSSDNWNWRHPRLFHQVHGSNTQIWTQWTTNRNSEAGLCIVHLRNIHNANVDTLWYGWYGFKQHIIDNATDEWYKRAWVCVFMLKVDFFRYLVWLQILHLYILTC